MKTKEIFTKEFYKELGDYLVNCMNDDGWYSDQMDDVVHNRHIGMDCDCVGDVYVTCEVEFDFERSYSNVPYDETWDVIVTEVYDIKNVHVYEDNNKDAKEIEGFDVEAFYEANKAA